MTRVSSSPTCPSLRSTSARTPIAETPVAGSVSGTFGATTARGGAAQTITEVDSGGKPRDRYDLAEHRWSIPASHGNQTLTVVASDLRQRGRRQRLRRRVLDRRHDVGAVRNDLQRRHPRHDRIDRGADRHGRVRVIDTDRTRGNTTHNSVAVDFLEIVGDGADVQPPLATATVATLTTSTQSAGRGDQYGVVTVRVSDDLGVPVSGATVTVALSGSFGGTLTGITGANGTATMATNGTARKPSFSACVASIVGGNILPYSRGTESC